MMDATKLFRHFYPHHKKSCGVNCVFYTEDHVKKHLDYATARLIQGRIMKHLYDTGWRMPKDASFDYLDKKIAEYGHIACQPERLSEKDWFEFSKLLEPVCDSLNSVR
jgi:hypothetical protein